MQPQLQNTSVELHHYCVAFLYINIAQYCIQSSPLHFTPLQTCTFWHQLDFSEKHSSCAAKLLHQDYLLGTVAEQLHLWVVLGPVQRCMTCQHLAAQCFVLGGHGSLHFLNKGINLSGKGVFVLTCFPMKVILGSLGHMALQTLWN